MFLTQSHTRNAIARCVMRSSLRLTRATRAATAATTNMGIILWIAHLCISHATSVLLFGDKISLLTMKSVSLFIVTTAAL